MKNSEAKIHVIGIGGDGLAGLIGRARELLLAADLVLGSETTLNLAPEMKAQRIVIGPNLHEVVALL